MIQVISTAQASLAHGIKVLVYGKTGMGKTRLLASAPAPIILSAENGLLSLRQYDLPAIPIRNLAELREAYLWVAGPKGQQFRTVGLDSVSEIAELIIEQEKKSNKDGRKAYGEMQEQMVRILRDFRDLPNKHVVFIAKEEFTTDGLNGYKAFRPSFPGQNLPAAVPYFFDEVWQLNRFKDPATGANIFALRTQPDSQNDAKDRSGVLVEWENADPATGGGLDYLFNKMQKG